MPSDTLIIFQQLVNKTVSLGSSNVHTRSTNAIGRDTGFSLSPLPLGGGQGEGITYHSVTYAYNAFGLFLSVTSGGNTYSYSYLPGSDLISGMTASGGHAWTRSYEPHRNLISAVENRYGETVISRFDYINDALGRRVARVDSGSAFGCVVTNTFGYNVRSELALAFMGTNRFGYVFDPIGNRTVATNNAELLTYLANELNQYTNITDGVTLEPTYDSDGNMTWDGRFSYTWDAGNRLVAAYSNSVCIVSNAYDHMSRRVRKVTPYALHTFVYDGWNLVQEVIYTASGASTNRYVWGLDLSGSIQGTGGIGGLLSASLDGTTAFYCYDANGNVGQLVGPDGDLLAHYEYSPFGEIIVSTGPLAKVNPFRFSTKHWDEKPCLYYYGFRFYRQELGSWISREPLGESGGLNLYGFGPNNPVNGFDYLGLAWGNARALWHYYFGGDRDVTLGEIGHYGTVTAAVQPKMDEWKQKAIDAAEQAGGGLSCPNNTSDSVSDSDSVEVHSGVWWVGGILFARSYSCSVQIDGDCYDCPETWSYSCSMSYSMNDEFSGILDHDNSGDDPWDDWTLGGTPFSVIGSWSDEASGGGSL